MDDHHSDHEHGHHAPVTHSHVPHHDFDQEHRGEAHVHDHDAPTGRSGGAV